MSGSKLIRRFEATHVRLGPHQPGSSANDFLANLIYVCAAYLLHSRTWDCSGNLGPNRDPPRRARKPSGLARRAPPCRARRARRRQALRLLGQHRRRPQPPLNLTRTGPRRTCIIPKALRQRGLSGICPWASGSWYPQAPHWTPPCQGPKHVSGIT